MEHSKIQLHRVPRNPLHLLDDFLSSLPTKKPGVVPHKNEECDAGSNSSSTPSSAERKHDLVLRAAGDLLGNNGSLLESALALLEEQEKYERESSSNSAGGNENKVIPVIRKIRARRSGRDAILVRKQQRKQSASAGDGVSKSKSGKIKNEYYLCLLGRDRSNIHPIVRGENNNINWTNIHRQGTHCNCRSFYQKIKGGVTRSSAEHTNRSLDYDRSDQLLHSTDTIVCKHLLASILMPYLLPWSEKGVEEDQVDDRKFAKLVMRASIG